MERERIASTEIFLRTPSLSVGSSGWSSRGKTRLTPEQHQEVVRASTLHPDVALAFQLAQTFAKMLCERTVEALSGWLTAAQASSIPSIVQLAQGIERDRAAVEAALSRPESNG